MTVAINRKVYHEASMRPSLLGDRFISVWSSPEAHDWLRSHGNHRIDLILKAVDDLDDGTVQHVLIDLVDSDLGAKVIGAEVIDKIEELQGNVEIMVPRQTFGTEEG